MKKLIALLAVTVIAASLAGAAGARSSYRWPRYEERDFILSCAGKPGNSVTFCTCTLRWIEKRYSYSRITYIFNNQPFVLARILKRASMACSP